jgi:hypothetical protein
VPILVWQGGGSHLFFHQQGVCLLGHIVLRLWYISLWVDSGQRLILVDRPLVTHRTDVLFLVIFDDFFEYFQAVV